jgi:hypothetical protein
VTFAGPTYCHVCPDGHTWTEQDDGGVSPSYGYGGTSHTWPRYDPRTCPEPERVETGHGYRCVCGEVWFTGGCGCKRWKPPRPVCRKPPAATFLWVDKPRRRSEPSGWVDVTERQLTIDGSPIWRQPADAIRELRARAVAA